MGVVVAKPFDEELLYLAPTNAFDTGGKDLFNLIERFTIVNHRIRG